MDGADGVPGLLRVPFTVLPILVGLGGLAAITAALVGPEESWTVDADGIAIERRTLFNRRRSTFVDADRARGAYVLKSTSSASPQEGGGSTSYAVVIPSGGTGRPLRYGTPDGLAAAEDALIRIRAALGPARLGG